MKPPVIVMITDDSIVVAVAEDAGGWRISRRQAQPPTTLFESSGVDDFAAQVRQAVEELQATSVTLVIPLHWVFTQRLPAPKRVTDQELAYEFEAHLPIPLEQLTYTFIRRRESALGIAVTTEPLCSLIRVVEQAGIPVEHIFVDAIALGLQATVGTTVILDRRWLRGYTVEGELPLPFLLGFGESAQPFETRGQEDHDPWTLLDVRERDLEPGAPDDGGAERVSREAIEGIADAACAGEESDLRTGELAARRRWASLERRARGSLACAALLLLAILVGLFLRARALKEHVAALEAAQLEVYAQVFPTGTWPPEAAMRLASERKKLEGLTRQEASKTVIEAEPPLDALRSFVAALPPDVRIFVESMRLDEGQLSLRGRTAEHRDAERIVEALSKVPGLETRPPRTTRLSDGGVEFSILARRQGHD